MPDSLDIDYLKPFLESTIDAAARFRKVLIVMITASILAFGAAWNSTGTGWFNSRLALTRQAEKYLILRDKKLRLAQLERAMGDQSGEQSVNSDTRKIEEEKETILRDVNDIVRMDDPKHQWLSHSTELENELNWEGYDKPKEWIRLRNLYNTAQATQYAHKLDEARTANILLVRIPLSGTVFDVNDLGLLGGITFMVILLMFRFTLWREYNNLWLTFREAKDGHLEYCYRSLAMQQVLTVPPSLSGSKPPQKPGRKIVRLLYFAPLAVQLFILVNDFYTKKIGSILDSLSTTISLTGSSVCFVFIVLLTYKCLRLAVLIDKEWKEWEPRARRHSTKSQAWNKPF